MWLSVFVCVFSQPLYKLSGECVCARGVGVLKGSWCCPDEPGFAVVGQRLGEGGSYPTEGIPVRQSQLKKKKKKKSTTAFNPKPTVYPLSSNRPQWNDKEAPHSHYAIASYSLGPRYRWRQYSQSLQLLHVVESPALNHRNLVFHQLPAGRGREREKRRSSSGTSVFSLQVSDKVKEALGFGC